MQLTFVVPLLDALLRKHGTKNLSSRPVIICMGWQAWRLE